MHFWSWKLISTKIHSYSTTHNFVLNLFTIAYSIHREKSRAAELKSAINIYKGLSDPAPAEPKGRDCQCCYCSLHHLSHLLKTSYILHLHDFTYVISVLQSFQDPCTSGEQSPAAGHGQYTFSKRDVTGKL